MSVKPAIRWSIARPRVLPKRTARSPRHVVVGAVCIFLALQIGIGVTAEAYPRLRDPLYGDKLAKLKRRLDSAGPGTATVIMLGSSRTGLAFHGRHAEAKMDQPAVAFNFGIPASGPVTHLLYLYRLLDAGMKPDLLIVEVMPAMVHDDPNGPRERLWFYADRIAFSEQRTLIDHGFDPATVRERYTLSKLLPSHTLRFQLMCRVVPSWLPWQVRFDWSRGSDDCGWGTFVSQTVGEEKRIAGIAQARAEYEAVLQGLSPGGGAAQALCDLLAKCHESNVPVRLVLMPEGTPFRDWYGNGANERLMAFLNRVCADYDVPLTDARNWLTDEMFSDGHHMLADGAEAFTDRLTREVILTALTPR